MSQLHERIAQASARTRNDWSQERMAFLLSSVQEKARRRSRRRRSVTLLSVTFLVLLTPLAYRSLSSEPPVKLGAVQRLADASIIQPLVPEASWQVEEDSPTQTRILLHHGSARFQVTKRPGRMFEIQASNVKVQVLGTTFVVAHEPQGVRVDVEEGHVRVTGPGGHGAAELRASESRVFALDGEERGPPSEPHADAGPGPKPHWWVLYEKGELASAWTWLVHEPLPHVAAGVEALLAAADVARANGHTEEAARFLRQALAEAEGDPRASVAAFTLGRVLLEDLQRPREGALEFARARELAPGGALAEDALGREVEAWRAAGQLGRARQAASLYLRLYPKGSHADRLRTWIERE